MHRLRYFSQQNKRSRNQKPQHILILLILISFVLASPAYGGMADDEWSGSDKTFHFGVGAIISGLTYEWCVIHHMTPWKAALVGVGLSALAGTIKEAIDFDRTGFSPKDLACTVGGGMVGVTILIPFDINW